MSFGLEQQLIVHLSQIKPNVSEVSALLKNDLSWEYIFKKAEEHRVVPIVFSQLKSNFSKLIPEQIYKNFQIRFQEISTYNFARTTQLINLDKLLKKHSIQMLSYKGMTLAELAYKDIRMRQFTDIDLLVKKKDFHKIKNLFAEINCRPAWSLTEKQEKSVLKIYYEYPFFYGKSNTLVEVHWDFIESFFVFDFDTKSLWDRTINVELYGKEIETLSPIDYLNVLCSHGSKHFWYRLSWICDIDRLIANTEIDWDLVQERALETESLRMVYLGIYMANKVLKTEIPTQIAEKISNDANVKTLGDKFIEGLFTQENEPDDWKEMAKKHMQMRENFTTKLKYSKRLFTTKLIDKLFLPMGRPQ